MLYKVTLTKTARIGRETSQAGSTVEVDELVLSSLKKHNAITGEVQKIKTDFIEGDFEEIEKPKRTRKAKAKVEEKVEEKAEEATEGEDVE